MTNTFQYQGYATGNYGDHKAEGVLLRYADTVKGVIYPLIFNAELTRDRTTKAGKKGDPLPAGQFRVGSGYAFTKHWERLGLPLPRRLSEFHFYMGKLKTVLITATVDSTGNIQKASINPVINHQTRTRQGDENHQTRRLKTPDNDQTSTRQAPDNYQTRKPLEPAETLGLQANWSTTKGNQESAIKAIALNSLSGTCLAVESDTFSDTQRKQPQAQSVDEWLSDYCSVTRLPVRVVSKMEIPTHISQWMADMGAAHAQRMARKSRGVNL